VAPFWRWRVILDEAKSKWKRSPRAPQIATATTSNTMEGHPEAVPTPE